MCLLHASFLFCTLVTLYNLIWLLSAFFSYFIKFCSVCRLASRFCIHLVPSRSGVTWTSAVHRLIHSWLLFRKGLPASLDNHDHANTCHSNLHHLPPSSPTSLPSSVQTCYIFPWNKFARFRVVIFARPPEFLLLFLLDFINHVLQVISKAYVALRLLPENSSINWNRLLCSSGLWQISDGQVQHYAMKFNKPVGVCSLAQRLRRSTENR